MIVKKEMQMLLPMLTSAILQLFSFHRIYTDDVLIQQGIGDFPTQKPSSPILALILVL
ncbi:hypothetical protein [Virgibacillus sp. L01]|uniref:hypothetical protein n=1 Tax=Virgibacillus sp. L01 TaxID=3457429 RepID=UPI003FD15CA0